MKKYEDDRGISAVGLGAGLVEKSKNQQQKQQQLGSGDGSKSVKIGVGGVTDFILLMGEKKINFQKDIVN